MRFPELVWLVVGLLGQSLFSARFIIQWLVSEREKNSIIPIAFWYCSIGGGLILLLYAIHKSDPVFIIGQAFGIMIYARNLVLIHGKNKAISTS